MIGILSECITKLGKSKVSQCKSDISQHKSVGEKKTLTVILSESITKLGKLKASQCKSDISQDKSVTSQGGKNAWLGILSECITKLGKSMKVRKNERSVNKS